MINKNPYFIAEAGVNHNGQIDTAFKLIEDAKKAGADGIKFQTFKTERLASEQAELCAYAKSSSELHHNQRSMLKKLELSYDEFKEIKNYCDRCKIDFLSTPFDIESAKFLNSLNVKIFKVASGELTNLPLIKCISEYNRVTLFSTGMASFKEIEFIIDFCTRSGLSKENIYILQCTTEYPTPMDDINLNVIPEIKKRFGVKVGFSDHSLGNVAAIGAIALGASIVEKHFTLNKHMEGPDQSASLEPKEFQNLVRSCQTCSIALGKNHKIVTKSEQDNMLKIRKSLFTNKDLPEGHIITEHDIECLRPGNGIPSIEFYNIVGLKCKRPLLSGYQIQTNDLSTS